MCIRDSWKPVLRFHRSNSSATSTTSDKTRAIEVQDIPLTFQDAFMSANFQQLANFIWSVADLLRGPYRPPQYERVMLPLTVPVSYTHLDVYKRQLPAAAVRWLRRKIPQSVRSLRTGYGHGVGPG